MKTLIVIDMQNDFVTGVLGSKEAVAVLPNVKKKIDAYIAAGETNEGRHLPVPHCVKGTDGWQVVKEIDCPDCEHIDKPTFGYIHWAEQFKDSRISEIEIIGVCTDICVISNALILKAIFPEMDISVDASCCAGVTPETHRAALTAMKACQVNVIGE